ncbi:glycosyltransferase family 4 protein [Saccharolobus islandicus]|uniref:Glycosyl transferase group 1 n=3 Tax=Saccharolobus islandicus TaxID=43080 RepID=C4KES5_SACI6|nr:glycosyltransferase family 1 protein [Sulfolobus islandicus]ACP37454.1 glycosyl transferase group 1 [Sulfolobus islandicus M.14.25]ACP54598.1 glycosyl transferase group 1 [Sulfolobus islandicus M.16.27]ACR41272.1 glycosyl transferase group 1 [Sulfolobus islandicus M.16.4]
MKIALMGFAGTNKEWSLGRLTFLFYKGLKELGEDVYLISKYPLNREFRFVEIKKFPKILGKDILTDIFSHYFTVRKLNPNIYHFIYPYVSATIMLYFPAKYKKLLTIHDLKPLALPEFMNKKEKINILILKSVIKNINRVIAISESTKIQLIEYLNIDEDKISVVYNPVDPLFKKLNDHEISPIRQKIGRFILNVSRYDKLKNPLNLIKSFKIIRKCFDIKLVITGEYWNYGINMIKSELGNINDVIIYTHLPDIELVKYYNASEVFLFPSIYEGFGMPIVEAMACGTPVVTSNRWAMKELAEGVGLLADPEDPEDIAEKVCKVLSDPNLKADMIRKGLNKASQFNYINIAKSLLKVYEEA